MNPATRIVTAGGLALGAASVAVAIGESLWVSESKKLMRQLRESATPSRSNYSPSQLEGLPEPVIRYFRLVLTPGQPIVRRVRIRHSGSFRMGDVNGRWVPFRSYQHYTTRPRGFVWDARLQMIPGLHVVARDTYIDGRGSMKAKVASLMTVANEHDRDDMDEGALHRWLAEAVWFPTALLPGEGVEWEGVDRHTARATIQDRGTRVSLEFTFDDRGEIVRALAPERMRDVAGEGVPTPWVCHYHDYHLCDAMLVPERGEVEWILEEGPLSYWRGRVDAIDFD